MPSPPPEIPEPDWAELDEPRSPAVVAIHRELTNNGPLTLQELEAALVGLRVDVTEHDLDDLVEGEIPLVTEIGITDPPVYVALGHLLNRRVFTHRLTASEIESDVVAIEPDLVAMSTITIGSPFNRLEAGDRIEQVFARDGEYLGTALDLPTGALSDYRAGDLIGFSLGHGGLRIEPVGLVAAVPNDLPDRVHGLLRHDVQAPLILEDLFLQLCVDDPALFVDALPPVAEMLDDWDVEREGDYLAPSGFDFAGWRMDQRAVVLRLQYGITADETLAVEVLRHLYFEVHALVEAIDPDALDDPATLDDPDALDNPDPATTGTAAVLPSPEVATPGSIHDPAVQAAVRLLADPRVAAALFEETVGEGVEEAVALGVLVESLEPAAPRQARGALRWLRGLCQERLGQVLAAEADFGESLALDPRFAIPLLSLSRYAADRGDAVRALSLLRRAGVEENDPLIQELVPFVPVERSDVGRNDPCWCGSGRKYKRCHLGRIELAPPDHATWLYLKAVTFLNDGPHRDLLFELAEIRSENQHGESADFLGERVVIDVALFDGGVLQDFLATRGVLLPDVEQLMLAQWLTVDRSVFEVQDVQRGRRVTLRDIRTGDRHQLSDTALSTSVRDGDLVCARLLPVGETVEIFGGVEPVPLQLLDVTLEALDTFTGEDADPEEMMEILSFRFRPPTLTNGDGDPLVLCSAEFELAPADTHTLAGALDDNYGPPDERDGTDGTARVRRWDYVAPGALGPRILAALTLTGTLLSVESNGTRRFDEVIAVVRAAAPGASVVSETREPAGDMFRRGRELSAASASASASASGSTAADSSPGPGGGATESPFLDPSDPVVAEALAEFTADYENRWLDMELPALAGLTPRQAADDPTRREDLIRLLDSFAGFAQGPGTMSPTRLRRALRL